MANKSLKLTGIMEVLYHVNPPQSIDSLDQLTPSNYKMVTSLWSMSEFDSYWDVYRCLQHDAKDYAAPRNIGRFDLFNFCSKTPYKRHVTGVFLDIAADKHLIPTGETVQVTKYNPCIFLIKLPNPVKFFSKTKA